MSEGPQGRACVARLALDPQRLREVEARAALAVAEMSGRTPPAMAEALAALAGHRCEGRLTVTFQTDAAGRVLRRTREAEVETTAPGGLRERRATVEAVERRPAD